MAQFKLELPDDIIKDIQKIDKNYEQIFGGMVKAGAEAAQSNVKSLVPASWRGSEIMNCIHLTRVYRTPSDDGINCKVNISGYFYNKQGVRTPAPLVANVFEYGSSKFTKHPFFRKAFKKGQIESIMMQKQKELSGGLLDE